MFGNFTSTAAAPEPPLDFEALLAPARALLAARATLPEIIQSDLAPLDVAYLTQADFFRPLDPWPAYVPPARSKLLIHPRLLARVLNWTDAELDALPPGWQLVESVQAQIAGLPVHMAWHMDWRRPLSPIERLRADQVCSARHRRIAGEQQP
jgi:hypothetical protein